MEIPEKIEKKEGAVVFIEDDKANVDPVPAQEVDQEKEKDEKDKVNEAKLFIDVSNVFAESSNCYMQIKREKVFKKMKDGFTMPFSYEGKQFSIQTYLDDSKIIVHNLIMRVSILLCFDEQKLNSQGYTLFLSDVEIQDKEYFESKDKMKLIKEGYILPVVARIKEVEYTKETSVEITNVKSLHKFFDDVHFGKYASHKELTIHISIISCDLLFRNNV